GAVLALGDALAELVHVVDARLLVLAQPGEPRTRDEHGDDQTGRDTGYAPAHLDPPPYARYVTLRAYGIRPQPSSQKRMAPRGSGGTCPGRPRGRDAPLRVYNSAGLASDDVLVELPAS